MRDRRRSEAPLALPSAAPIEHQAANEVIRSIFSAMINQGITQAEFAERIGVSERTLEKWRSPALFHERAEGPGLILIARALLALGLTIDVTKSPDASTPDKTTRFPLSVRNGLAQVGRDIRRRGETFDEFQSRVERNKSDAQRKGLIEGN